MAFLQLIAVTLLAVAFCEDVPQGQASDGPTFLQRENYLLKLLLGHKDLKWNGNEVNGVRTVIEDIRAGKDPKAEDPATKMELALAYRNLLKENPFREEQIKEEFRQNLGSDIAQQLFDVGEQIMEAELEAKDQFQRDFNMNYHEKNALQKLEKDVVAGKDPLHESPKIMRRINKDGRKLFNLTPEDQDTEKALLTATYGEETAQQILDAIKVIREEVQAKASADADAEEAMKAEIGG
ncbi:PREDICTED: uncharacterized protein LOC109486809 isoform X1 [Branchiostoma belcheri]|uniref:Uncharacterized protein LOC109486809 isoform X1 n=1 Tax=Branchiostoma belcheri TaxID=7741 RepID=A0A6P5AWB9_BRABE|nr:PREDICTED: uncharacterized protein LOC109486809 isoform X1 [Branchiostoma belcheri]